MELIHCRYLFSFPTQSSDSVLITVCEHGSSVGAINHRTRHRKSTSRRPIKAVSQACVNRRLVLGGCAFLMIDKVGPADAAGVIRVPDVGFHDVNKPDDVLDQVFSQEETLMQAYDSYAGDPGQARQRTRCETRSFCHCSPRFQCSLVPAFAT